MEYGALSPQDWPVHEPCENCKYHVLQEMVWAFSVISGSSTSHGAVGGKHAAVARRERVHTGASRYPFVSTPGLYNISLIILQYTALECSS